MLTIDALYVCACMHVILTAHSSAPSSAVGGLAAECGHSHSHSPQEQKSNSPADASMQPVVSAIKSGLVCFVNGCSRAASVYCARCEHNSCEAHMHKLKIGHTVVPIGEKHTISAELIALTRKKAVEKARETLLAKQAAATRITGVEKKQNALKAKQSKALSELSSENASRIDSACEKVIAVIRAKQTALHAKADPSAQPSHSKALKKALALLKRAEKTEAEMTRKLAAKALKINSAAQTKLAIQSEIKNSFLGCASAILNESHTAHLARYFANVRVTSTVSRKCIVPCVSVSDQSA
jgi:hypothetical protein